MNRGFILVILLGLTLSIGLWPLARPYFPHRISEIKNALPTIPTSNTSSMELSSPNFLASGLLPIAQTCDGRGVPPELHLQHAPNDAASIVITMIDIDVPSMPGGKFYHWGMWDIPPTTTAIPSGNVPTGASIAKNSAGQIAYAPACPPTGEHRYIFTAYALPKTVTIPAGATVEQLFTISKSKSIASASLIGRYQRGK